MNKKFKLLMKDTIIFALGNFGSKIILFLLVPLYTNYLSTEQYGSSEFVFTMSQLLYPIVSLCIYEGVIRIGLKKEIKKENTLFGAFLIWIGACIVLTLLTPLWSLYEPISRWKWYLSLYTALHILSSIELNYLKVKDKNMLFALSCVIQTLVLALLNIYLLVFKHAGVEGYLIANCSALVISVIVIFVFGKLYVDLSIAHFDKSVVRDMLIYSVPLIVNNISWWLINSSDKIMIQAMLVASELGLYTVATKIPSLINVFINIFSQAWSISSIKEIESSNDSEFYSDVFNIYTTLIFGVAILIISIVKPFMSLYVSKEFFSSWTFVPLLIVASVFSSLAAYFASLMGALQISKKTMQTTMVGAVVNIVFNYVFILLIGTWGAIVGTVFAYAAISALRAFVTTRYIKLNICYPRILINITILVSQALFVSANFAVYCISAITIIIFGINNSCSLNKAIKCIKGIIKNHNG